MSDLIWKWIPHDSYEWDRFILFRDNYDKNYKIAAIKDVRTLTSGGLKECKDLVEYWETGVDSCDSVKRFYDHEYANSNKPLKQKRLIQMPEEFIQDMKKIEEEIKAAVVLNADPDVIAADLEAGLVCTETASRARLYPSGEVEKAKTDHLERLKRIAVSQAEGVASARGIKDASSNLDGGDPEKKVSQNHDMSPDGKPLVRGEGK